MVERQRALGPPRGRRPVTPSCRSAARNIFLALRGRGRVRTMGTGAPSRRAIARGAISTALLAIAVTCGVGCHHSATVQTAARRHAAQFGGAPDRVEVEEVSYDGYRNRGTFAATGCGVRQVYYCRSNECVADGTDEPPRFGRTDVWPLVVFATSAKVRLRSRVLPRLSMRPWLLPAAVQSPVQSRAHLFSRPHVPARLMVGSAGVDEGVSRWRG